VRGGDSSCEAEIPHARRKLLTRGENLSCGVGTCRERRKLVVRSGDLSEEPPPVGDLSGKPPAGRRQGVLPVKILTGLCNPPYAGSWPSHCQWCQMTPS
jgi:hypothetical protein